jgi:hypothetical protein
MKKLILIAIGGLLLLVGIIVSRFVDELMIERFLVVEHQWKLSQDDPMILSEGLAVEGINLAMRENDQDPANWQAVPTWKDSPGILRHNVKNPSAGTITLSNLTSGSKLIATIELDQSNRVINILISRPK